MRPANLQAVFIVSQDDEEPDLGPAWDWKVVRNDDPHDRDVPCVINKLRVPGERVIKVVAGHHHSMCISLELKKKSHRVCVGGADHSQPTSPSLATHIPCVVCGDADMRGGTTRKASLDSVIAPTDSAPRM